MNKQEVLISDRKIGSWKGGLLLVRASWSTLKIDKELLLFPILEGVYGTIWLAIMAVLLYGINFLFGNTIVQLYGIEQFPMPKRVGLVFVLITILGTYVISNYFLAAIIASAVHRFNGNDPDVKYGLARARLRLKSLIKFSLVQGTIGSLIQLAEEKLPFVGKIVISLVGIVWTLASFFAVPVIVLSDSEVGPIEALRKSASIFNKTWTSNVTGGLTMGAIFLTAFLAWFAMAVSAMIFIDAFGYWIIPIYLILLALLLALISIMSALQGVFVAALYHFATTGQSPVEFDGELLHAAFKPKKGWFV